ncbi:hypothetical protein QYE76_017875 [Lolium multiflorum]|uniref:Uncharacterized protein n=1 Tax=Lolium multiflorum TaxID=4521 RepID=A0AAD8QF86_LOLMU|nr:hypothetical protein QYE76_017875 [Lolium multiflorum]
MGRDGSLHGLPREIANMSANDNVAGTSKAAMTLEEKPAANVEFWEFGPSQRQEEEEVDLAAEEVGADRQMTEAGEEEERAVGGGRSPEAESSSQGSTEPWDTPFNMALNIHKERPISKPPTYWTCLRLWYKHEVSRVLQRGKQQEERSAMSLEDKAEVEELRKKVSMLEEKQANSMDKDEVDKLFEKRLRDFLPPQGIEGIAAWNAAGRVGPIKVPSAGANSIFNASPSPVGYPAPIAAGQPVELDEQVPRSCRGYQGAAAAVVLHNAHEPQKIDRPAALSPH